MWLKRSVAILMVLCGIARMPTAFALQQRACTRGGDGGGDVEGSRPVVRPVVAAVGLISFVAASVFFFSSVAVGAAHVADVLVPIVVPLLMGWWVWGKVGGTGGGTGGGAVERVTLLLLCSVVAIAGLTPFLLFTRPAV